jgi:nitric oxide reductase NorE protein
MSQSELPAFLRPAPPVAVRAPRAAVIASPGHVPGEAGVWVFILGDLTLFGAFFVGLLVSRSLEKEVFEASAIALDSTIGGTNTLVLLTSSLLVILALAATRRGSSTLSRALFAAAVGCALVFISLKVFEYSRIIGEGHSPDENTFFTFYFILTGIHLLHVIIGAALLITVASRRSVGMPFIEGVAAYWHMVDLLWIALFTLLYLEPGA